MTILVALVVSNFSNYSKINQNILQCSALQRNCPFAIFPYILANFKDLDVEKTEPYLQYLFKVLYKDFEKVLTKKILKM